MRTSSLNVIALVFIVVVAAWVNPASTQLAQRRRVVVPESFQERLANQPTARVFVVSEGRVDTVTASPQVMALEPDQDLAVFRRGDSIERTTSPVLAQQHPEWRAAKTIPEDYVARVRDAGGTGEGEVVVVRPIFRARGDMRYDEGTRQFQGSLLILLEDTAAPLVSRTLEDPIWIEIVSAAETVEPERISISHTNLPATTVDLAERNPQDSVSVSFITSTNLDGYDTYVGVEPALVIETPPRRIQGWGVESISIGVAVRGATFEDSVMVRLETSLGSMEPQEVFVRSGESASARLRSAGKGIAAVRAASPEYATAGVEFEYVFPLWFICFSLAGGVVGALIAFARRRSKGERPSLPNYLMGGVGWGVVVTLAYGVLGLNLLRMDVQIFEHNNEALVFVVSAIGAVSWLPKR